VSLPVNGGVAVPNERPVGVDADSHSTPLYSTSSYSAPLYTTPLARIEHTDTHNPVAIH